MIQRVFIFLLAASVQCLSSCSGDKGKVTTDMIHFPKSASGNGNEKLPVINFDSTVYNFAPIAEGEKLKFRFRFENTGNAPLFITRVEADCGCVVADDWPREPIEPGGRGTITVEFNSSGRAGKIDKSVFVAANTYPANVTLRLVGEVRGITEEAPHPSNPVFAPYN